MCSGCCGSRGPQKGPAPPHPPCCSAARHETAAGGAKGASTVTCSGCARLCLSLMNCSQFPQKSNVSRPCVTYPFLLQFHYWFAGSGMQAALTRISKPHMAPASSIAPSGTKPSCKLVVQVVCVCVCVHVCVCVCMCVHACVSAVRAEH